MASVQFPPQIDIVNEATTKQVAEAYRHGLLLGEHQARIMAAKFHPCVIATLRHHGLDGTNRFGYGSDAKKVADEISRALNRSAEHMKTAAHFIDAAELIIQGRLWTPVQLAIKAQQSGQSSQVLIP